MFRLDIYLHIIFTTHAADNAVADEYGFFVENILRILRIFGENILRLLRFLAKNFLRN